MRFIALFLACSLLLSFAHVHGFHLFGKNTGQSQNFEHDKVQLMVDHQRSGGSGHCGGLVHTATCHFKCLVARKKPRCVGGKCACNGHHLF